jgi:hypothetical protein
MRYNVRCCCEPNKILGTLELDGMMAARARSLGGLRIFALNSLSFSALADPDTVPFIETVDVHIRPFVTYGRGISMSEDAVYSDDRPVDAWARVPGFIELAKSAPR